MSTTCRTWVLPLDPQSLNFLLSFFQSFLLRTWEPEKPGQIRERVIGFFYVWWSLRRLFFVWFFWGVRLLLYRYNKGWVVVAVVLPMSLCVTLGLMGIFFVFEL